MSERSDIMAKIYLISDTHFNNDKAMDETIIKNWNNTVNEDDIVYHLGNFGNGNFDELKLIFDKLNGHKYLIMSHHDTSYGKKFFLKLGFKEVYEEEYTIGKYVLTHYPKDIVPGKINIYGTNNDETLQNFKNKNCICVSLEKISYSPIMLKEE